MREERARGWGEGEAWTAEKKKLGRRREERARGWGEGEAWTEENK